MWLLCSHELSKESLVLYSDFPINLDLKEMLNIGLYISQAYQLLAIHKELNVYLLHFLLICGLE